MRRPFPILVTLLLLLPTNAPAAAPKVVITSPDNGEIDVSPDIKEIRIEFDQPMNPGGRSIVGGGETFPKFAGDPKWLDQKTFIIPVTLQPAHQYQLSFNNDTFKNFTSKTGQPAEMYPLRFKTRAAGAPAPPPDVTPEQNKAALAALKKAIDDDYSYRDRNKIDWAKEFTTRQKQFENAKTANEVARAAAHLLRLAEDAHVSVAAGDTRIYTRPNSASPNFNFQVLRQAVPAWKQQQNGLITGRFDDGIGYILFSQCTKAQADDFDAALDELKDTKGLIIDVRFNGGGDELAARQVAGRFIDKPTVYSKNRLREKGAWNGPFDRIVQPRPDRKRYTNPIAVLIGPKIVSSAESFILMMKHGAGAKLIGDSTRGSSGRPMPHQLGNGVTVYLSSWEDQLPDGTLLEGAGVSPDIPIKTNFPDFSRSDPVLEAALKTLRAPRTRLQ
jgi:hypothetical protein